jgi:hypothetical protein
VGLQLMVLPNGELSKEESTFHQLSVRSWRNISLILMRAWTSIKDVRV